MPFTVEAPKGSDLYFWSSPVGVQVIDRGNILEVISAPKGELRFGLKAIQIDWDAKKLVQKLGTVTVILGEGPAPPVPPIPPGPDPEPTPVDQFEKSLFETWRLNGGTSPTKAPRIKLMASIYLEASKLAQSDGIKTAYQLYQQGVLAAIEKEFKPKADSAAEFLPIRNAVGIELNSKLPTKVTEPLTPETRKQCEEQLARVARALAKLEVVK